MIVYRSSNENRVIASPVRGVAISSTKVAIISAPINMEFLKFSMLSKIVLSRTAKQEIATSPLAPHNDSAGITCCIRGISALTEKQKRGKIIIEI